MDSKRSRRASGEHRWAGLGGMAVALAVVMVAGCDGVLDVDDPTIVTPDQLTGPQAVPTVLNGLVRDFQEAYDDHVRYTSMFTDEMILAGTFQGRVEVDERRVRSENQQITGELYEPFQRARQSAEEAIASFEASLDDPEFESVLPTLRVGVARGNLIAGYLHLMMAEIYCAVVVDPAGPALSSDEAVQEALVFLETAEARASEFGLPEIASAARVGQARAHLWLGNLTQAADLADAVSSDFVRVVEYSSNSPGQNNELAQFTWGFIQQIRWSVGDGTTAERDNELYDYLDEWVAQGLVDPDPGPGFSAQNAVIPVVLQQIYDSQESNMVLASGWEARMIEAEVELRTGDPEAAEDDVNDLLTDPTQAFNPMLAVNPGLALGAFQPVDFTGDLSNDLPQLARARAAGLWLTGQRQATSRRFSEGDGIDLYPVRDGGALDVCLPVPQQEVDDNPNL